MLVMPLLLLLCFVSFVSMFMHFFLLFSCDDYLSIYLSISLSIYLSICWFWICVGYIDVYICFCVMCYLVKPVCWAFTKRVTVLQVSQILACRKRVVIGLVSFMLCSYLFFIYCIYSIYFIIWYVYLVLFINSLYTFIVILFIGVDFLLFYFFGYFCCFKYSASCYIFHVFVFYFM